MEGYTSGKSIASILHEDWVDGAYYHQEWQRMPQMTQLIFGGTNVCFLLTLDIEQLISDSRSLRQGTTSTPRAHVRSGSLREPS